MSAHRTLALLALAAGVVACDGSDKSSGPSNNNNQQVVNRLTQLSTRMASTPAGGFVGFAIGGLSLGVQPSTINVTTDLSRRGPVTEGVSLSTAGAAKGMEAVAFRVILQNYPGETGDIQMNGGVMWTPDLNEFVVVIGTGATGSFGDLTGLDDFSLGALFTVSPQASWMATTGTMNVSGGPVGSGGSACPGTVEGMTCRLGTFTFGYNITASEPFGLSGDAATGSRTATLSSTSVNGYTITMDWENLPSEQRAMYDRMVQAAR